MLNFAALVPHPLLSLPEIGKDRFSLVKNTVSAYERIAAELYAAKIETVVLISVHTDLVSGAFTINQRPRLRADFSAYGDLIDQFECANEIGFGYRLRESVEDSMPVILTESEQLDYRSAVPLFHMIRPAMRDKISIVDIGTTDLPLSAHIAFGAALNGAVTQSNARIAVIASGDLAHGSAPHNGLPPDEAAAAFSNELYRIVSNHDRDALYRLSVDHTSLNESASAPLAVLFGALGERRVKPRIESYEAPVGVGYLAAVFDFI